MPRGHNVAYERPFWVDLYRSIPIEQKQAVWKFINYRPHDAQLLVHSSKARFKTVNCGRRWGKTDGVVVGEFVPVLCLGGWCWVCGADYDTASLSYEAIVQRFTKAPLSELVATDPVMQPGRQRMVLKNGGVLWGKSLYSDRKLRGRGLDLIGIDEAAMQPTDVPVQMALMPSLTDHRGGLILTSTPRGRNWFKDRHDRGNKMLLGPGERDAHPDWESWTFPTSSNPYFPLSELEREREEKSEAEFRQEFLAEFLDETGTVFRGWNEIAVERMKAMGAYGVIREDMTGARFFVIGVDIAVVHDWTYIWVLDAMSGRTVYMERFQQVDHFLMCDRVRQVSSMFGDAPVVIDATNNTSFVEMVQHACPRSRIEGFKISTSTRPFIINELGLAIEKKMITLPDGKGPRLSRYALVEISAFAYCDHGKTKRPEAPPGYHDDGVFALALANYARMTMATGGSGFSQPSKEDQPSLREDLSPLGKPLDQPGSILGGQRRKKSVARLSG